MRATTFVSVLGLAAFAAADDMPATYDNNKPAAYDGNVPDSYSNNNVTPPEPQPTYPCNPAHDYGNGASCEEQSGSLTLVYPSPTAPPSPPEFTTTEINTAYTTYCPGPTTFEHNNKTYVVTGATTITVEQCTGGCPVASSVPVVPVVPVGPTTPVEVPTTPVQTPVVPETPVPETPVPKSPVPETPVVPETPAVPETTPCPPTDVPPATGTFPPPVVPTASATTTTPAEYTGAAVKLAQKGFAALAILAGAAML
ncbi:Cell wall protein Sed1/Spi1 [Teratosphaeria destructans]|uniref:Cell wall protein Sed1/Spi1 n=1 Tax=Teratosphaeria destructans TaxID=418781 RepID=A0A9W7SYB9_9PEZI|nr:Cell wall protein Sed1/Spi1 [Teratosphaeria destructans]